MRSEGAFLYALCALSDYGLISRTFASIATFGVSSFDCIRYDLVGGCSWNAKYRML